MDSLDVELTDADLLGEVELTATLIVAANQSDRHLSPAEIDRALGLSPDHSHHLEPRLGAARPE